MAVGGLVGLMVEVLCVPEVWEKVVLEVCLGEELCGAGLGQMAAHSFSAFIPYS